MRIGIDCRLIGRHARGIGRYTLELIENLETIESDNEYVVFVNIGSESVWAPKKNSWKKVVVDIPPYSFREQATFHKIIKKEKLDLMHFTHYNVPLGTATPYIVTIHDLLLHRHPTSNASSRNRFFFYLKYIAYRVVFRYSIKRAVKIIAVSKFTQGELYHYYPFCDQKTTVVYEGVKKHRAVIERGSEERNSLLYVGAAYPHKNLKETIRTLHPLLTAYECTYTLVGRKDYFYNRLAQWLKEENMKQVTLKGELTDSELAKQFTEARAFIFPSLYEGFGLPPLEALIQGCPVIAYASGAVSETAGDYVDLYHTQSELLKKIENVLKGRRRVVPAAFQRKIIETYSWKRMAEKTESLYTSVHGHSRKT